MFPSIRNEAMPIKTDLPQSDKWLFRLPTGWHMQPVNNVPGIYWSSTENNASNAWNVNFNNGNGNNNNKTNTYRVRCVR